MKSDEKIAILEQIKKNNRRIQTLKRSIRDMLAELYATIKQQSLLFAEMRSTGKAWTECVSKEIRATSGDVCRLHGVYRTISNRANLDKSSLQSLGLLPPPKAKPVKSKGVKPKSPLLEAGKSLSRLLSLNPSKAEKEMIKNMMEQIKNKL